MFPLRECCSDNYMRETYEQKRLDTFEVDSATAGLRLKGRNH
jgi:hypothetical protein